MNKNKWITVVVIVVLVVAAGVYLKSTKGSFVSHVSSSPIELKLTAQELEQIKKMIQADLEIPKDASEDMKLQKAYINMLLRAKPEAQNLFMQTYKFFGARPETFSAARYMALYSEMTGGQDFKQTMAWTYQEVKEHSQAIMDRLLENKELISQYPAYQIAAINMVHQLEVSPDTKAKFYSSAIYQKVELNEQGELLDKSRGFELAMIMAKNDKISASMLQIVFKSLAQKNAGDEKVMAALRVRVENYYPEMVSFFSVQ